MTDPHLVLIRWRRYGHDRLYIAYNDGTRIGHWDLNTSAAHPEPGIDPSVIELAATGWLTASSQPTRHSEPATFGADPSEVPVNAHAVNNIDLPDTLAPAEFDCDDLANTKAGAAARAQAQALRDAAPVRTFLARALRVKTDERAWRIGADGEEAVAAQLHKLGERWHVLHAVPIGNKGSDIDHVVIGPAGVFTLNAKNHPDANIWVRGNTFKVNGKNVPYVRHSRYEATRTAKVLAAATGLDVPVTGAVVIYGATGGLTIKEQPEYVHIVARRKVTQWLRRLPAVLTDEQVAYIYDHARRSTTWRAASR